MRCLQPWRNGEHDAREQRHENDKNEEYNGDW
jgi:hypothetical protein